MESHLLPQAVKFNSRCVSRGASSLAVFLLATQVVAQNPIIPDSVDQAPAATGLPQIAAAPFAPVPTEISAPASEQQEANLSSPQRIPFLALEAGQNTGQSSSQDAPAATTPTKTAATGTKPPHHGLGVALAIVGTTALVAGAVLLAGEKSISVCNGSSSGCNEARDTGIALMPIGAAVAVTGFYLQFHR
ncbi:MAG: hypothetical protein ABSD70_02595 [Terracidiphilus sp.]|jgi:hypothetical protein